MKENEEYIEYDSPEILEPGGGYGELVNFDPTYSPLDVKNMETELMIKSKKVIKECTEVFFKTGEITKPDYVDAIQSIEEMNLETMLSQVKIASHMINSLVNRLNESGTTDLNLFRMIMDAQNHALSLTMNVSTYVRNLPGYFKGLKFEMSPGLPELTEADLEQQRQIREKEGGTSDMDINLPQMGTKDLLKYLEEVDKQRMQNTEEATS